MALELLEVGEFTAVRAMLQRATPLQELGVVDPERFRRLDKLSSVEADKEDEMVSGRRGNIFHKVDDARHIL